MANPRKRVTIGRPADHHEANAEFLGYDQTSRRACWRLARRRAEQGGGRAGFECTGTSLELADADVWTGRGKGNAIFLILLTTPGATLPTGGPRWPRFDRLLLDLVGWAWAPTRPRQSFASPSKPIFARRSKILDAFWPRGSGFVREPGRKKQASTNEERDTLERATENYFGCRWEPRRPGAPFFASGGFCALYFALPFCGKKVPQCRLSVVY